MRYMLPGLCIYSLLLIFYLYHPANMLIEYLNENMSADRPTIRPIVYHPKFWIISSLVLAVCSRVPLFIGGIKRLRDAGLSPWWLLTHFLPFIGLPTALIVCLAFESETGANIQTSNSSRPTTSE